MNQMRNYNKVKSLNRLRASIMRTGYCHRYMKFV